MNWTRHLFRKKTVWKTTWKLRLGIGLLLAAVLIPTRSSWLARIGRSLVHDDAPVAADVIVVENYNQDYLVFETAARLLHAGYAERILIPVSVFSDPDRPGMVAEGFVNVMTRIAGIENPELLPVQMSEPITLAVARQVGDRLRQADVRRVVVVAGPFRSRRTYEVYREVLDPLGMTVACVAARTSLTPENWWQSTHGVQQVLLEWIKLHYYRWAVLRS